MSVIKTLQEGVFWQHGWPGQIATQHLHFSHFFFMLIMFSYFSFLFLHFFLLLYVMTCFCGQWFRREFHPGLLVVSGADEGQTNTYIMVASDRLATRIMRDFPFLWHWCLMAKSVQWKPLDLHIQILFSVHMINIAHLNQAVSCIAQPIEWLQ